MTLTKLIKYTQLPSSEYSQQTLGIHSGTRIETDQILLQPIQLDRDAPLLWEVYKNHTYLFNYMPHGALETYEEFYKIQERFCQSSDFFNWVCYVSAHPREDPEKKKWVLCGSICLLDISLPFRRFEVGSIWFHPAVQSTFVMLETTYALLRFSFERLQAGRVQWKTHSENIASQKAATKLGFDLDGLHRKHIIHSDGTWRHTYFYSMTDDDWFGREETRDGRRGLDVASTAEATTAEQARKEAQGRQRRLEELIAERKRGGKALPSIVVEGGALSA
ncbi:acyl-CoA N-acyltransferase [Gamsiella multidivaricata]|uniref:acyl-CoA N-acyltransferase n=1 Tax=Gamsiella multidivaricata TaxID=101098 RepID=UPI00221F7C1B|nr:acyl-CoA N-acyltransferase [Gamsiella multidivaricata]KAG0371158.1 hypothetical protein BGZ54_009517 [Gamsiella multidivaricata]KAI7823637.1 acyl-CoA N-acyltransferase [Gamsiella multidivaricata]